MCARLSGTIRREGPMRARPVEMMRVRPLGVRGRLVVEVWRPLRDLVVVRDLVDGGMGRGRTILFRLCGGRVNRTQSYGRSEGYRGEL